MEFGDVGKEHSRSSLACLGSLSTPLVQEVVISADIRCSECQRKVALIMSRMDEIESVVVSLLEKTVILTCKYPIVAKNSAKQVTVYRQSPKKITMIKRLFGYSRS